MFIRIVTILSLAATLGLIVTCGACLASFIACCVSIVALAFEAVYNRNPFALVVVVINAMTAGLIAANIF